MGMKPNLECLVKSLFWMRSLQQDQKKRMKLQRESPRFRSIIIPFHLYGLHCRDLQARNEGKSYYWSQGCSKLLPMIRNLSQKLRSQQQYVRLRWVVENWTFSYKNWCPIRLKKISLIRSWEECISDWKSTIKTISLEDSQRPHLVTKPELKACPTTATITSKASLVYKTLSLSIVLFVYWIMPKKTAVSGL